MYHVGGHRKRRWLLPWDIWDEVSDVCQLATVSGVSSGIANNFPSCQWDRARCSVPECVTSSKLQVSSRAVILLFHSASYNKNMTYYSIMIAYTEIH